jgi:biotin operon repressor
MPDMREKTLIIKDTSLKRGFTSIPNIVLTSSLSFGAKTIYSLLLMFAWQEKETFPGQARLAQDAGCTERTVRTYLNELKKVGLITWKQRVPGSKTADKNNAQCGLLSVYQGIL